MKKILKISSILLSMLLLFSSAISVYSASYLTSNGFSYATENNGAIIYDYDNRSLDVIIPNKLGYNHVSEIGEYAFMNNSQILSVSFSEAKYLKKLNTFAFSGCTKISSIVIPSWLNEISVSTFQNCTSLNSVVIYSNITEIPEQAFYKCTSLKEINLPNSLKSIGRYAFGNCTSLESITIPKNVDFIADYAFRNCDNLTISCFKNSYAHTYAIENNIPFSLIDGDVYELGDVDLSGGIDIKDATLIQKYLADIETLDATQLSVVDYNQDGEVNIMDATAIQKYLVS